MKDGYITHEFRKTVGGKYRLKGLSSLGRA